jgi:hypothetical protein
MTLVIDGTIRDEGYTFSDDFIPPFLSAETKAPAAEEEPPALAEPTRDATEETPNGEVAPLVAIPLGELATAGEAPVHTKKKRALMGMIRGVWTFIFAVGGEALVYITNNITSLNLPPGLGVVVGATASGIGYGIKKYVSPDTLI